MSRFTDAAKRAVTNSFVTEGREKVSTDDIIKKFPECVTIIAFDKIKKDDDEFYAVAFKEDLGSFFFSGTVLTSILDEITTMLIDGDYESLSKELEAEGGIRVRLHTERAEKSGRNYTACDILD